MSLSVSDRAARVQPSATGAVLARAIELRQAGVDLISLGTGEPDFDTPEHILAAAHRAIDSGQTRYTAISGTAELKAAIRAKLRRDNGLEYEDHEILVSGGAKQSIYNLCQAYLSAGAEAIIPAPYWVSYPEMVRLADAEPVVVETGFDSAFKLTPEALEAALTPQSRLLMLNSPCNPTGAAYTHAELKELGSVLESWPDVLVVADDIYEHIRLDGEPHTSFATACPALAERTVTVNGVSKAYAMTGWRIGYAAGPRWLIEAMTTVQSQSTSNPCSVSQAAAVAALNGDQRPVLDMVNAYRERHAFVVAALNDIEGVRCHASAGTFYAFPEVREASENLGVDGDVALCERLLETARVALVPGTAFGAPGFVRLSFATSLEALEIALGRLKSDLSA